MAGAAADRERAVRDLEVYVLAREDGHLWGEARASRLCPGGEQSVKPDAEATERGAAQQRAAVPCGSMVHFTIPRRPTAVRRAIGRASWRARVWRAESIVVGAGSLKKKEKQTQQ